MLVQVNSGFSWENWVIVFTNVEEGDVLTKSDDQHIVSKGAEVLLNSQGGLWLLLWDWWYNKALWNLLPDVRSKVSIRTTQLSSGLIHIGFTKTPPLTSPHSWLARWSASGDDICWKSFYWVSTTESAFWSTCSLALLTWVAAPNVICIGDLTLLQHCVRLCTCVGRAQLISTSRLNV